MDLMNSIFKDYRDKGVLVFIDNIIIFSKNVKEHEERLRLFLEMLRVHKPYAKFTKCHFWRNKAKLLGHVINSEGLAINLNEVMAILD